MYQPKSISLLYKRYAYQKSEDGYDISLLTSYEGEPVAVCSEVTGDKLGELVGSIETGDELGDLVGSNVAKKTFGTSRIH